MVKYCILLALLLSISDLYAQVEVSSKSYTVNECIKQADEYEQQGDFRTATNFLNGAAFYVWDEKNYDLAIELFNRSILLNQKINNIGGIAGIESNLGMIYNDKKDYPNALAALQKALEIRIKQKEKLPILKTHINISVVLNNLNRFDESIKHLNEALKLASEINDIDELKVCYASLSETYDKKGDRKSSVKYFEDYITIGKGALVERESKIKASIDKIQRDIELTDSERNDKEVQLALKEKQLRDKQAQLYLTDSTNKALSQRILSADSKLQSLEKEEAIKELQRQKIQNKLKQEQQIRLFIIVIIAVLLVFLFVVYNALRRIKRLNRLLTERNEEVIHKKQSLEDENKIRTKLLSILSHDLRTPLSAVYLFLQILRSKTLSPEMVDKHLAKLEATLNTSFQMLDNMLYWAKSQVNGIKYNPSVVDIADSVVSNIEFLSTNIQNKSIEILNNINDIIYIYADKEMVNIILRNLISNAVKFTPQEGKITLSYKKDKHSVVISIQDNGVGITKEQQATLFTPQIVSQSGTAKETGTGLGLVLVHDFVELCKGRITFESAENKGTTFYVTLPLANLNQLKQKAK